MPRATDSADRDDGDVEADLDDEDASTIDCPYCGKAICEESPRCPHCGQYLSQEDAPPGRKPLWIVIGVLLCLYIVYRWVVG
ncbi:MAG: zinc ribbon domain-containing protein [Planctomycetaceae bacterium]